MHVFSIPRPDSNGPALVLTRRNTTPSGVSLACAVAREFGEDFRDGVFEPIPRGAHALTVLWPRQTPPLSELDRARCPGIALLADDDDSTRLGPDGWRYAQRVMRWASGVLLHGTGGLPEHYVFAAQMAQAVRRLVLVETASWRLDVWEEAARKGGVRPGRILRLQPTDGVHPILTPSGAVH